MVQADERCADRLVNVCMLLPASTPAFSLVARSVEVYKLRRYSWPLTGNS